MGFFGRSVNKSLKEEEESFSPCKLEVRRANSFEATFNKLSAGDVSLPACWKAVVVMMTITPIEISKHRKIAKKGLHPLLFLPEPRRRLNPLDRCDEPRPIVH